jgi:predicted short-subunit dehydrogenase-like oxidoreductase (DUF2520 family)
MGVYGRDEDAANDLSTSLDTNRYDEIKDIIDGEMDMCFLCVSDGAVGEVAGQLSFTKTVLVHTAGALSIDVLKAAATERAVLWPVYSISRNQMPEHRNIPCAWEGSGTKAREYMLEIGEAVTDVLFEARYEQRKWLHLSAVIGNNFVNHLLAICEQICEHNGLSFDLLRPIIAQTFERTKHASPMDVQTGPAIRGDENTIEQQMVLLTAHPEWQRVYEALTASIQKTKITA